MVARRGCDFVGRGDRAVARAGSDERDVRADAPARIPDNVLAEMTVEARLWEALRGVEDPEIPVSVVGMGLIVSLTYVESERRADLQITFTAMGCPAMEFIQDDIREALLADPDVDFVDIEVVWDPVWTKARLRDDARSRMRELVIAV